MLGSMISSVVKGFTLPIDVAESALDVMTGGDGSKQSKQHNDNFMSEIRDGICKGLEDLDE